MKLTKNIVLSTLLMGSLAITTYTSCKKKDKTEDKGDPILTTVAITDITSTTATSGGDITSEGKSAITARGVCWSTSSGPTIANSKTVDGSGTGSFTSKITGLKDTTDYYVRAYATNNEGTFYGDEKKFKSSIGNTMVLSNSTLDADVDALMFSANLVTQTNQNNQMIFSGVRTDVSKTINITIPAIVVTGNYSLSITKTDYAAAYYDGKDYYMAKSGTLSIIEYNAGTGLIKGQFNFVGQNTTTIGAPDVNVKAGSFIIYKK